jgi:hypothetical protein|uniref:Uncharacterized protein n=1 Tax=Sipha flava TaxID=143950 RepID=A0A2S2QVF4_9HEMI
MYKPLQLQAIDIITIYVLLTRIYCIAVSFRPTQSTMKKRCIRTPRSMVHASALPDTGFNEWCRLKHPDACDPESMVVELQPSFQDVVPIYFNTLIGPGPVASLAKR